MFVGSDGKWWLKVEVEMIGELMDGLSSFSGDGGLQDVVGMRVCEGQNLWCKEDEVQYQERKFSSDDGPVGKNGINWSGYLGYGDGRETQTRCKKNEQLTDHVRCDQNMKIEECSSGVQSLRERK